MDAIIHRNEYDRQVVIDALKRIDVLATESGIAWKAGIGTGTVPGVLRRLIDEKRVRQVGSGRYELVVLPPSPPGYPKTL